jgi:hypothetical protein
MNPPYSVHYINRDKNEVVEFVVDSVLGGPFEGDETQARQYAESCNRTLESRGLPGKCFVVLARSLTQAEIVDLALLTQT